MFLYSNIDPFLDPQQTPNVPTNTTEPSNVVAIVDETQAETKHNP